MKLLRRGRYILRPIEKIELIELAAEFVEAAKQAIEDDILLFAKYTVAFNSSARADVLDLADSAERSVNMEESSEDSDVQRIHSMRSDRYLLDSLDELAEVFSRVFNEEQITDLVDDIWLNEEISRFFAREGAHHLARVFAPKL